MIAPPSAGRPGGNRRQNNVEQEAVMFRILELDSQRSASPTQVGEGFATWEDALAAIKRHLKRFKVSGRNPEGSYWWTRDADGLRKCWISEHQDAAPEAVGVEVANGGQPAPAHDPSK
jgi:hypothetical protein